MLVPQACLAALCVGLGLFPGRRAPRARRRDGVAAWACSRRRTWCRAGSAMASGLASFDQRDPRGARRGACWAALVVAGVLTRRRGAAARRVPTWGCGGELTARTEYTATAFSKPLMMIFRAVYRPTREVEALAEVSPYFPQRGALPLGDRADVRALRLRPARARGAAGRRRA